jgi:hypothetical protein
LKTIIRSHSQALWMSPSVPAPPARSGPGRPQWQAPVSARRLLGGCQRRRCARALPLQGANERRGAAVAVAGARAADGAGALPNSGAMMLTGGVEAADGKSALVGLPVGTDGGSAATAQVQLPPAAFRTARSASSGSRQTRSSMAGHDLMIVGQRAERRQENGVQ